MTHLLAVTADVRPVYTVNYGYSDVLFRELDESKKTSRCFQTSIYMSYIRKCSLFQTVQQDLSDGAITEETVMSVQKVSPVIYIFL